MIDGITSLRDGPLLVASDQLISLMEQIPIILEAHAEKSDEIEELIDDFKGDAKTCVDHAQEGFVVAPTIEKQIRSVQLCVSAYIATKCCYEGRPRLLQQLREAYRVRGIQAPQARPYHVRRPSPAPPYRGRSSAGLQEGEGKENPRSRDDYSSRRKLLQHQRTRPDHPKVFGCEEQDCPRCSSLSRQGPPTVWRI